MKSIKQIRELQVQLSENVESSGDVRKLTTLVRAGLFDPNKLTMLKRALNKDNVKMTRAERDALLELLDRLLTVVMANQGTFMKVKQSIQEEISPEQDGEFSMARSDLKTAISSAQRILDKLNGEGKLESWLQSKITLASDYLSSAANYVDSGEAELKEEYEEYDIENLDEATRTDVDINQIPPIIIMKRRAIRVFPDGQKVALYWADRINKYISVPFQSIGISEAKEDDDSDIETGIEARRRSLSGVNPTKSAQNRQARIDATKRKMGIIGRATRYVKKGAASASGVSGSASLKAGHSLGYALGKALKDRSVKKKVMQKAATARSRAGEVKQLRKSNVAAAAGVGHSESFRHKLAMIREQREVNEVVPLAIAAAARLAPAAIRAGGALLRSRAAKKIGGALLKSGKKVAGFGKKVLRKALRGAGKVGKFAGTAALGALAGGGSNENGGGANDKTYNTDRQDSPAFKGTSVRSTNPYASARQRAADISFSRQQQESYKMIKSIAEGSDTKELNFADGAVELSPSVASKIVETYNALNTDNKKIVLEMINKDKNSFMKFANFASVK